MVEFPPAVPAGNNIERLADLVVGAPVPMFALNADLAVVWSNSRFCELGSAGARTSVREAVHPDDRDDLVAFLADTRARVPRSSAEFRWFGGDGGIQKCSVTVASRSGSGADRSDLLCFLGIAPSPDPLPTAGRDLLTGLADRHAVTEQLSAFLDDSPDQNLAVLFLDLDSFKEVNDSHGHAEGDRLLTVIAERLRNAVRPADLVGRLGGDEFLIVSATGPGADDALALAHRIARTVNEPLAVGVFDLHPQVSIGVATGAGSSTTGEQLLVDADVAMYEAKHTDVSVVLADRSLRQNARNRSAIDRDLLVALRNGDLCFHHQPVCRLVGGEVLGTEALLRWEHPELGYVPPLQIIERIESLGLTEEFNAWGVDRVCRDLAELRRRVPKFVDKQTSYNLTARQLEWSGYVEAHRAALAQHGLRDEDVIIEVTEQANLAGRHIAEETIRELAEAGALIALDDFGAGFNALVYFTRFPVQAVKVDRSLVDAAPRSRQGRAVLENLRDLADRLGIALVAEGIETEEELNVALEVGITEGQGYLLGRPVSIDEFVRIEAEFDAGIGERRELMAALASAPNR